MLHKVQVVPVRVKYLDNDAHVIVLRTVGYRAWCGCGWRGQSRDEWQEARQQGRNHQVQARGTNHVSGFGGA